LKEISSLRSSYSIRLYELIKQFEQTGNRTISLEKFRDFFQLGEKYNEFKHLRARVIKPAINELNKKSPLTISVDLERRLRKVIALQFTWKEKDS
jgi:plasmid replication initiation protein